MCVDKEGNILKHVSIEKNQESAKTMNCSMYIFYSDKLFFDIIF